MKKIISIGKVLLLTIILIVLLVQLIQVLGQTISKKIDKRRKAK